MTTIALESGHFYKRDGTPAYTVIGTNGKERPATLRDARKLNLLPSVSEIIRCAAKPALDVWKQNQILLAALTLPRRNGENDESFCARIRDDSREQARKAADRGSALHTSIERALQCKPYEHQGHVKAVMSNLEWTGISLRLGESEHSFAHPSGFGGKVDWHHKDGLGCVIDFKSKERIEPGKKLAWDEHCIQLAAYANGLGMPAARLLNVFIGLEDCKVQVYEWTLDEAKRGWEQFKCLLQYWKLSKNYDCSFFSQTELTKG